jgi:CRP/FNR family transcriptional regulator, dissimilatory nitrate respiration regulator
MAPAIDTLLAGIPLFASMRARALAQIAKRSTEIDAPPRTTLYQPGDPCTGLYVIVSGRVKLALQDRANEEKVIDLLGPGDCFGHSAVFVDEPHLLAAATLGQAKLVHIAKSGLLSCIRRDREFAYQMLIAFTWRLRDLISELANATQLSGTERTIHFLLGEVTDPGADGAATVTLPAKKRIIASRLDLTQEHFSRILRDLASTRLIAVDGAKVKIPSLRRLRAYSE